MVQIFGLLTDITKYPYLLSILNQLMFQLTFIESYWLVDIYSRHLGNFTFVYFTLCLFAILFGTGILEVGIGSSSKRLLEAVFCLVGRGASSSKLPDLVEDFTKEASKSFTSKSLVSFSFSASRFSSSTILNC